MVEDYTCAAHMGCRTDEQNGIGPVDGVIRKPAIVGFGLHEGATGHTGNDGDQAVGNSRLNEQRKHLLAVGLHFESLLPQVVQAEHIFFHND